MTWIALAMASILTGCLACVLLLYLAWADEDEDES